MNNLEAAIGQKPIGADVSVRRAKMADAAKQNCSVRRQPNVMKQAGRDFIKKHGKAGFMLLENIGAERGQALAVRQGEQATLGVVQRAAVERDKLRSAGEGGIAISGGNLAGERPIAREGGEGEHYPLGESGADNFPAGMLLLSINSFQISVANISKISESSFGNCRILAWALLLSIGSYTTLIEWFRDAHALTMSSTFPIAKPLFEPTFILSRIALAADSIFSVREPAKYSTQVVDKLVSVVLSANASLKTPYTLSSPSFASFCHGTYLTRLWSVGIFS